MSGAEHIHEVVDVAGLSPQEIGQRLRERFDEGIAADVADLLVQGFTIEQIEIEETQPEVADGRLRVGFTVTGRRAPVR